MGRKLLALGEVTSGGLQSPFKDEVVGREMVQ
jgi:hypothetical protein